MSLDLHVADLYPHQWDIMQWDDNARFELAAMQARSGKGVTGALKVTKRTSEMFDIWSTRDHKEFHPRWVVWCVAPTYDLAEQQWLDVQAYLPKKFWGGEPVKSPIMRIPLIRDGIIEFKSADRPQMLVSKPVDYLWITEAREIKSQVWSFLRQRMMSPGRSQYSRAFIEGTVGRMSDPDDPLKLHWFYAMMLSGRGAQRNPEYRSFYWYDDKVNYGNLDHPILSRTPEGRLEVESLRNDPNMSEDEFQMGVLGRFLSGRTGRPVIRGFQPPIHVAEAPKDSFIDSLPYNPRYDLLRWWDFGRGYPACTIHQLMPDNTWHVLGEVCPFLQDMIDVDFGRLVQNSCRKWFGEITKDVKGKERVWDIGDNEAKNKDDRMLESTQEAFKNELGIDLILPSKEHGDEQMAVEILNARMKLRNDGKPNIRIHPRCTLTIKGFEGEWIFETGKSSDIEWIKDSVCEIHPYIDIFDTLKYGCKHFLAPLRTREYREDRHRHQPRRRMILDESGAPTGRYEEVYA